MNNIIMNISENMSKKGGEQHNMFLQTLIKSNRRQMPALFDSKYKS